jgi:hypothetical protein
LSFTPSAFAAFLGARDRGASLLMHVLQVADHPVVLDEFLGRDVV